MKDAYETSTRDICSPVPTVDAEIIALADGSGFAVAVNVYPLPGQPVGILWFRDGGTAAYAFPFGPGEKTVWLQPGQLAMLMVPEIRRMAILLDSIPPDERAKVEIVWYMRQGSGRENKLKLVNVDLLGSSVIFAEASLGKVLQAAVPLDAVKMVWRNFGGWCVLVHGSVQKRNDEDRWEYSPPI